LRDVHVTEIDVGFCRRRIKFQGVLKGVDGMVEIFFVGVNNAEQVVSLERWKD